MAVESANKNRLETEPISQSYCRDLNPEPIDYKSIALPLSHNSSKTSAVGIAVISNAPTREPFSFGHLFRDLSSCY